MTTSWPPVGPVLAWTPDVRDAGPRDRWPRSSGFALERCSAGGVVLEALGFTPLEERVYDLLVSRGRLSLHDVQALGDGEPERQREAQSTTASTVTPTGPRGSGHCRPRLDCRVEG